MPPTSKIKGMRELRRTLREAPARMRKAAAGALYAEGLDTIAVAVRDTPVDTGRLRNSGFCTVPFGTNQPALDAGFATEYAELVHEIHPTQSHFFQRAIDALSPTSKERQLKRIQRFFETGTGVSSVPTTTPETPEEAEAQGRSMSRDRKRR